MTREEIKQLALKSGFKLKPHPDGSEDLNPYVYDFARRLVNIISNKDRVHYCEHKIELLESTVKLLDWMESSLESDKTFEVLREMKHMRGNMQEDIVTTKIVRDISEKKGDSQFTPLDVIAAMDARGVFSRGISK